MRCWRRVETALIVGLLLAGCDDKPQGTVVPTATPTAIPPTATAEAATPPKPKAYEGPSGVVIGKVTMTGESPKTPFTYPKGCEAASGTYGKLFRLGQDGGLADALVAVTDYGKRYVPPKSDAVELTIQNCAYSQRTVALTDGQHIEIRNVDVMRSYLPHLDGARLPAGIVAVPRGPVVKLETRGLARYWLRDQMARNFMVAHVFHLPYATSDVTDLSGKFRIEGVPVGKAKVSVLVPQLNMKRETKEIEVKEGDNEITFELTFDPDKDVPADGHGGGKGAAVPSAPDADSTAKPGPTAAPTAEPGPGKAP